LKSQYNFPAATEKNMPEYSSIQSSQQNRITLAELLKRHKAGRRFAMLTAYDFPTAAAAQAAGVPTLLVGDSAGSVVLGHETTRDVPLEFMFTIADAVRRGAPDVYLVGDMPFSAMAAGEQRVIEASQCFCRQIGCDAVKIEVAREDLSLIENLTQLGIDTITHIGLRPQQVTDPSGYRVHAREPEQIQQLVKDALACEQAGAAMLLIEAVPPEASQAVVEAVKIPTIGCGAGPACSGHVVVTSDMLGIGTQRPPRFVPVLEHLNDRIETAMQQWVRDIETGSYPAEEHRYRIRSAAAQGH
jgi:3-methyl-2-oxobutanoate hydroxymethyltransferase